MKRPLGTLFVTLAYVATLFAPLRTAWACPDGTQCVPERGGGFACAEGQCAAEKSCCISKETVRCKHGALPAVRVAAADRPAIQGAAHCTFSVEAKPNLVALGSQPLTVDAPAEALPVLQSVLLRPVFAPIWRFEYTLGYRPPPLTLSGPSRAPPFA